MMDRIEASSKLKTVIEEEEEPLQKHRAYGSISSETMSRRNKRKRFPKSSVIEVDYDDYGVGDSYNLRELEKMSLSLQMDTRSILTDEDGVDIEEENESEDEEEDEDDLLSPDGSGSDTTLQSSLNRRK